MSQSIIVAAAGVLVATVTFAQIVESDAPGTVEEWILTALGSVLFGTSVGTCLYVFALVASHGWEKLVWVAAFLLGGIYLKWGLTYALWEISRFRERPIQSLITATLMMFFWPVVMIPMTWALAGEDD